MDSLPRGYGFSYRCFNVHGSMAYPIPLNLIVRWARNFHIWLKGCVQPSWADERFMAMYRLGEQAAEKRYQDRIARIEKIVDEILDWR